MSGLRLAARQRDIADEASAQQRTDVNAILSELGLDAELPSDDELIRLMAEHPVAGERILLRIPDLTVIAPVVRHERAICARSSAG